MADPDLVLGEFRGPQRLVGRAVVEAPPETGGDQERDRRGQPELNAEFPLARSRRCPNDDNALPGRSGLHVRTHRLAYAGESVPCQKFR
jgi:hypothetical protein